MSHLVLARKWRPKKFSDLVGQNNTIKILHNIIGENRLHHAYLLTGTRGVGKTTIARIIAKALNCLDLQNNEPCCICTNCTQIDSGRFVDVIEIDAASNTGVDNIREVIENAQYTPTSGKYKVFIIDEVHMLSKSAFNAMLKTLEEPPAHIIFILATTDPQKVPITVISRCLQLKLRNLSSAEIAPHLQHVLQQENYSADNSAIELLANAANGSMRDALSLTDQAIAFSTNNQIHSQSVEQMLGLSNEDSLYTILNAIATSDSNAIVNICQELNQNGANFENVLQQLQNKIFQISLAQLSSTKIDDKLRDLAQKISLQDIQLYFDIINLGLEQINKISQKYNVFTMTLLRIISFTIGTQEEKQVIIQANNCSVQTIIEQSKDLLVDIPQNLEAAPAETIEIKFETPVEKFVEENEYIDDIPPFDIEEPQIQKPIYFTSWLDFVKSIDLSTIPQNIASVINNFEQISGIHDNLINLNISSNYQPFINSDVVDYIEKLLHEKYSEEYDLNINFVTTQIINSGSQQQKNQIAENQRNAMLAIESDEIIKTLQDKFSATILPNSIKPLNT